jgi:hypothetical protein
VLHCLKGADSTWAAVQLASAGAAGAAGVRGWGVTAVGGRGRPAASPAGCAACLCAMLPCCCAWCPCGCCCCWGGATAALAPVGWLM